MSVRTAVPAKPRLRGVSHQVAFFVSLVTGPALVAAAHRWPARLATAIYALTTTALFGVSALFHRRTWSPAGSRRMRRLDHSTIYVAIAGTYTAVAGLALRGGLRVAILGVVWTGAVAGVASKLLWPDAPAGVVAAPYVALGWVAVAVLPALYRTLGPGGVAVLVAGGALYTAGAVVYALQRPDPIPAVFGFHEVFHAFVIGGAGLHYAVVAAFALPRVH